ncbi:MAG: nucleotidyltransferase family protein [Hornefia sp.]|nr:nucleotidyltransferase family protein [Hornefia sp.]
MSSIGIIAEFNPFHEGHGYLIEKAKEISQNGTTVAVMSGNFTQRGMPAAFDKWKRAECAVKNGVNLVVELPVVFACNSAEFFAKGAVEILEGFGAIDKIIFGSEAGDINKLKSIADAINRYDDDIKAKAVKSIKEGISYPKAREMALDSIISNLDKELIAAPNNILAIEYLRKIKNLEPVTIRRRGLSYHTSGSEERKKLQRLYPGKYETMDRNYYNLVTAKILESDVKELEKIFLSDSGLTGRLKKRIRYSSNIENLIEKIKTKGYTETRVSRLLAQILLGIEKDLPENPANYIRILAFDSRGASFIKEVKRTESNTLPIITNINKELDDLPEVIPLMEKDILASDIYNLLTMNDLYDHSDYIKKPFIL